MRTLFERRAPVYVLLINYLPMAKRTFVAPASHTRAARALTTVPPPCVCVSILVGVRSITHRYTVHTCAR